MKLVFFASFILFCIFITTSIRKRKLSDEKENASFWEKEHKANLTRKKSIDHLVFIQIPIDTFPTTLLLENEDIKDIINTISHLSECKILNLTGISNTDLKLEYGVANLSFLTQCDQNYTLLVRTLQKWADILIQNNYILQAQHLLEFSIETKTDISSTYYTLAKIYMENNQPEKISYLIETAEKLNSIMKNSIVRTLNKFDR